MSDASARVQSPPNGKEIFQAVCRKNWAFCAAGNGLYAVDADARWIELPPPPGAVQTAGARAVGQPLRDATWSAAGVNYVLADDRVVVAVGTDQFGVYPWGAEGWIGWFPLEPRGGNWEATLDDGLLVLRAVMTPVNCIHLMSVTPAGAEAVATFRTDEPGALLWSWREADTGVPCVLTSTGHFRVEHLDARIRPRLSKDRSAPALSLDTAGEIIARVGNRLYVERWDGCLGEIDVAQGSQRLTGFGKMPNAVELLRAWACGKADDARRILDAVPHDMFGFEGLLLRDGLPAAALARAGLLSFARAELPRRGIAPGLSDAHELTWRLWTDPDLAKPAAIDQLLDRSPFAGLLAQALAARLGERVWDTVLSQIRGKPVPEDFAKWLDGPRALAAAGGAQGRGAIQGALEDQDPFVLAVGAAAAGALDSNETPAVYANFREIPSRLLLEAAAHPHPAVSAAAIDSCANLQLEEAVGLLASRLSHADAGQRAAAVAKMSRLPLVPDPIVERIEGLALADEDDDVREAAVDALARISRGSATIETLIRALGDPAWEVRGSVAAALAPHAKELTGDHLFRLADAAGVLLVAARAARGEVPTTWTLNIDDLLENIVEEMADDLDDLDDAGTLQKLREDNNLAVNIARAVLLVLLQKGALAPEDAEQGGVNFEDLIKLLRTIGWPAVLSPADAEAYAENARNGALLCRVAVQASRVDQDLGLRLAGLARVVSKPGPAASEPRKTERSGPLHQRLKSASRTASPAQACDKLTRELADRGGLPGAFALACLAAGGDPSAALALGARILDGQLVDWPVMAAACRLMLPKPERISFVSSFASAESLPVRYRANALSAIDEDQLPPEAVVAIARALAVGTTSALQERPEASTAPAEGGCLADRVDETTDAIRTRASGDTGAGGPGAGSLEA